MKRILYLMTLCVAMTGVAVATPSIVDSTNWNYELTRSSDTTPLAVGTSGRDTLLWHTESGTDERTIDGSAHVARSTDPALEEFVTASEQATFVADSSYATIYQHRTGSTRSISTDAAIRAVASTRDANWYLTYDGDLTDVYNVDTGDSYIPDIDFTPDHLAVNGDHIAIAGGATLVIFDTAARSIEYSTILSSRPDELVAHNDGDGFLLATGSTLYHMTTGGAQTSTSVATDIGAIASNSTHVWAAGETSGDGRTNMVVSEYTLDTMTATGSATIDQSLYDTPAAMAATQHGFIVATTDGYIGFRTELAYTDDGQSNVKSVSDRALASGTAVHQYNDVHRKVFDYPTGVDDIASYGGYLWILYSGQLEVWYGGSRLWTRSTDATSIRAGIGANDEPVVIGTAPSAVTAFTVDGLRFRLGLDADNAAIADGHVPIHHDDTLSLYTIGDSGWSQQTSALGFSGTDDVAAATDTVAVRSGSTVTAYDHDLTVTAQTTASGDLISGDRLGIINSNGVVTVYDNDLDAITTLDRHQAAGSPYRAALYDGAALVGAGTTSYVYRQQVGFVQADASSICADAPTVDIPFSDTLVPISDRCAADTFTVDYINTTITDRFESPVSEHTLSTQYIAKNKTLTSNRTFKNVKTVPPDFPEAACAGCASQYVTTNGTALFEAEHDWVTVTQIGDTTVDSDTIEIGPPYTGKRAVTLNSTAPVTFHNLSARGGVTAPTACRYEAADGLIPTVAPGVSDSTVNMTCTSGRERSFELSITDFNDTTQYTGRAIVAVATNRTENTTLTYEMGSGRLTNIGQRSGLTVTVDNRTPTSVDVGSNMTITIGTGWGNSSLHAGNHTYIARYNYTGAGAGGLAPSPSRYSIVNGVCQQVSGGAYPTMELCQSHNAQEAVRDYIAGNATPTGPKYIEILTSRFFATKGAPSDILDMEIDINEYRNMTVGVSGFGPGCEYLNLFTDRTDSGLVDMTYGATYQLQPRESSTFYGTTPFVRVQEEFPASFGPDQTTCTVVVAPNEGRPDYQQVVIDLDPSIWDQFISFIEYALTVPERIL